MKKVIHVFTVSMSVIFLEDIYSKLKDRGYELIVICSDGEEVRYQEKLGNLRFYPVEMSRGINPFKDVTALIKIIKIMLKEKPSIVHGHTPKGGLLAMIAAKLLKVKNRPYHLHGLKYPGETGIRKKVIRAMERSTVSLSSGVFSVSHSLKSFAIQEGLGPVEKIKVLLNGSVKGIDIENSNAIIKKGRNYYKNKLKIKNNDCVIGFIGRITEEKGIVEFIISVKKLLGQNYNIGVILCGANEMKSEANKAQFLKFVELENVQYFGEVSDPLKYMACCDIFALPSYREGFGLVNIEANSVGVPVVTTNIVGCIDSIENNVTGITVKAKDENSLYNALKDLIETPTFRIKMGENGIKRVQELYDRNKIWNMLIDEYDSMI